MRILIVLLFAIGFNPTVFGQGPNDHNKEESRKDKVEALKISFITKELNLTEEESKEFWPLYDDMSDQMLASRKKQRTLNKKLRDGFELMSDDEIQETTQAILDNEIEQAELKKMHTEKIADLIGYRKVTKLLSLEQRFKRELLQRLNRTDKEKENSVKDN